MAGKISALVLTAVIIRSLFSGYEPYLVFAFVSPGATGLPFASR